MVSPSNRAPFTAKMWQAGLEFLCVKSRSFLSEDYLKVLKANLCPYYIKNMIVIYTLSVLSITLVKVCFNLKLALWSKLLLQTNATRSVIYMFIVQYTIVMIVTRL